MPTASFWGTGFVMWHSNIGAIVSEEIGAADWQAFQAEADKQYGHAGNLRKTLSISPPVLRRLGLPERGHRASNVFVVKS
jgi:hypothetical protein